MKDPKRPLGVTILAYLYIAVGVVGFVYHLSESLKRAAFGWDSVLVELSEALALLFGVFMLRGHNWARWGALAWMLLHVILNASRTFREFAIHAVFLAVIARLLFRPDASHYFRTPRSEPT